MRILVPIKQVPGITEVKINKERGTLEREGIVSIINPEDKNAIELALEFKDKSDAEIIVLTMGPPQAQDALVEALAMGCDRAFLISDRKFAGADTWATAYTLGKAIEKIGNYDLIICGRQAIDGDTAQVGPQLAGILDLPQITYVRKAELIKNGIKAEREIENGYELIEGNFPILITVTGEINEPRYAMIDLIFDAFSENKIEYLNASDLDVKEQFLGLDGSPTKVKKVFTPKKKQKGVLLEGNPKEIAQQVIENLRDKGLV